MIPRPLDALVLTGSPRERGLAQARLSGADPAAVRAVAESRFAAGRAVLESPAARTYLDGQAGFARAVAAPEWAELEGVAEGFGLDPAVVFALMHLSILSGRFETDGCTAWARPLPHGGAVLVKNRDLSGPHQAFQTVFVQDDPDFAGGPILAVGTLGAPGVYSSGINAAGLALADTAIAAPRHGIGWLRYLLMTRIAATCRTVDEACATIAAARHAGGGSLILADAGGAVVAVELLADGARIDRRPPAFRSNHFLAEPIEATAARISPSALASTIGRRANLAGRLDRGLGLAGIEAVAAAMADHGGGDVQGFCRHGEGDGAHTVSTSIYTTADRSLRFSRGRPCDSLWEAGSMLRPTAEAVR